MMRKFTKIFKSVFEKEIEEKMDKENKINKQ
jgi:hypothetical protein